MKRMYVLLGFLFLLTAAGCGAEAKEDKAKEAESPAKSLSDQVNEGLTKGLSSFKDEMTKHVDTKINEVKGELNKSIKALEGRVTTIESSPSGGVGSEQLDPLKGRVTALETAPSYVPVKMGGLIYYQKVDGSNPTPLAGPAATLKAMVDEIKESREALAELFPEDSVSRDDDTEADTETAITEEEADAAVRGALNRRFPGSYVRQGSPPGTIRRRLTYTGGRVPRSRFYFRLWHGPSLGRYRVYYQLYV